MAAHGAAKNYFIKQYIHAGGWVFLMKSGKAMIYSSLHEPMHQVLGNIFYRKISLEQTLKSAFSYKALEIKGIIPKDDDISDDLKSSVADPAYKLQKGNFGFVITYHAESSFKATTLLETKFLYVFF